MDIAEALQIVLDLAKQNVSRDDDEQPRQQEAINIVESLISALAWRVSSYASAPKPDDDPGSMGGRG